MATLTGSCASPTDITVLVLTDFACSDLHDVTVTVGALGRGLETEPYGVSSAVCHDHYAGRLVVVPSGSKSDVVAIKVVGGFGKTKRAEDCVATYEAGSLGRPSYGPGCIVARRALRYTPHTGLTVPILLRAACEHVACAETETCVQGRCQSAIIAQTASCEGEGCDESVLLDGGVLDAPAPAADAGVPDATLSDAGARDGTVPDFDAADDGAPQQGAPDATGDQPDVAETPLLQALTISIGTLVPEFSPTTFTYTIARSAVTLGLPLTVAATFAGGSAKVNGDSVASGAASPAIAMKLLAPTGIDVTVTGASGSLVHYTIVAPPQQEAYLKASNARASSLFGTVALSGETLAVGPLGDASKAGGVNGNQGDTSLARAGAVYVLTRSGTAWTQQAYIKASFPQSEGFFGASIALSGDTLAVGAQGDSSLSTGVNSAQGGAAAPRSGAVYVFTRTGVTWSQQAYVKASNTATDAFFGYAVALAGDTLAVGAYGEQGSATGVNGSQTGSLALAGAVYVFTRAGVTWSQQAYVKASNTDASASFGAALALAGDTLAVGAPGESTAGKGVDGASVPGVASTASGAAYVFARSGAAWTQQVFIKASNTGANANFGASLALSGDTLVVGSPGEQSNATGVGGNQADVSLTAAGAAYVFARSGATWTQQAYVKAPNTRSSARFGGSVALWGSTLAVGSMQESGISAGVNGDPFAVNAVAGMLGAAYLFARGGTAWSPQAYVKASNPQSNAVFGGVALSADTLVVGAEGESSNATGANGNQEDASAPNAGAVYVFR